MSARGSTEPEGTATARPPDEESAAALPLNAREGAVAVSPGGVPEDILLHEPLPRLIKRFALPAVGSNLLMTLFFTIDGYWVGTRVGSDALAAVSISVFWIWMTVAIAEMVSIGVTAVASRTAIPAANEAARHGPTGCRRTAYA